MIDDPATASAKAAEAIAKTTGQALEIVHDTGGYLDRVFGDLPANAVGLLGADWLRERRLQNLDALRRRTAEILRERAWVQARFGRKVRLKFGDVKAEARTPEELEALLRQVADFQDGKRNTGAVMNQLVPIISPTLPVLAAAGERASMRFLEFFAANIRNPHVATWIEASTGDAPPPPPPTLLTRMSMPP